MCSSDLDERLTWQSFERVAHLLHPLTDETEAVPLLFWAKRELAKRRTGEASDYPPAVFIIIDEAASLLDDDEAIRLVTHLTAQGRKYGFHIILAVQNPNAKSLGDPNVKRNMPTRLVFRVDSGQTASLATGRGETGAELLIGEGDGLLLLPSRTVRLTTALVMAENVTGLPQTSHERTLPLEGVAEADLPVRSGRKEERIEPEHVAWWLMHPEGSERQAYEQFHIGYPRIKAARAFAQGVERVRVGFEGG